MFTEFKYPKASKSHYWFKNYAGSCLFGGVALERVGTCSLHSQNKAPVYSCNCFFVGFSIIWAIWAKGTRFQQFFSFLRYLVCFFVFFSKNFRLWQNIIYIYIFFCGQAKKRLVCRFVMVFQLFYVAGCLGQGYQVLPVLMIFKVFFFCVSIKNIQSMTNI